MNSNKGTYALAVPAGIFLLLYGLISVICMLGFFATPVLETFLDWTRYLLPALAGFS